MIRLHRFSTVAGINRAATQAGQTFLLSENFETPTTGYESGTWTEETFSATIDPAYTAGPLVGSQSFRASSASGWARSISPTFAGASEMWYYFKFRLLVRAQHFLVAFYNGTTFLAGVALTSGTALVYCPFAVNTTTVGTMVADTTYNGWFHYKAGTGTDAIADFGFSTTSTRPTSGNNFCSLTNGQATLAPDRIYVGTAAGVGASTFDYVWDKIRVATSLIDGEPA